MNKKILAFLLAASMLVGIVACAENKNKDNVTTDTGISDTTADTDGTDETSGTADSTGNVTTNGQTSAGDETSGDASSTNAGTTPGDTTSETTSAGTKTDDTTTAETTDKEDVPVTNITIAESGKETEFKLIYGIASADRCNEFGSDIRTAVKDKTGVQLVMGADNSKGTGSNYEILINSTKRAEAKAVLDSLKTDEFAIKYIRSGEKTSVVIAYKGDKAREAAKNRFLADIVGASPSGKCVIADNTDVKKKAEWEDIVGNGEVKFPVTDHDIVSLYVVKTDFTNETYFPNVRDACVVYENGKYYLCYSMYANASGPASWVIRSASTLGGRWSARTTLITLNDLKNKYGFETYTTAYNWAPEIHKYKGKYYLFTTYWCGIEEHDSPYDQVHDGNHLKGHFASIIMRADTITGPYVPISVDADGELGHSTPAVWNTIDMTFYVDDNGQPWGIFSRDWTSSGGVGSFWAAKLSDDLTKFISEPIKLFSTDITTPFRNKGVSDGCYMYRTKEGELLLLWSPLVYDSNNYYWYSVAVARSKSGKVEGPWTMDSELLYSKTMYKGLDGGHPSIFTGANGQMWLTIHTPNSSPESPTFIPICEIDNKLVWGLSAKPE